MKGLYMASGRVPTHVFCVLREQKCYGAQLWAGFCYRISGWGTRPKTGKENKMDWRGHKMVMQAINKGKARPGIGCNTTRKDASQTLEFDCRIDMLSGRPAPNIIWES